MDPNKLTWTCMACGEERPDAAIAVAKHAIDLGPDVDGVAIENYRHCNDRQGCIDTARLPRTLRPRTLRPPPAAPPVVDDDRGEHLIRILAAAVAVGVVALAVLWVRDADALQVTTLDLGGHEVGAPNAWADRLYRVEGVLDDRAPALLLLQEADLAEGLGAAAAVAIDHAANNVMAMAGGYAAVPFDRPEWLMAGRLRSIYRQAILYDPARLTLLDHGLAPAGTLCPRWEIQGQFQGQPTWWVGRYQRHIAWARFADPEIGEFMAYTAHLCEIGIRDWPNAAPPFPPLYVPGEYEAEVRVSRTSYLVTLGNLALADGLPSVIGLAANSEGWFEQPAGVGGPVVFDGDRPEIETLLAGSGITEALPEQRSTWNGYTASPVILDWLTGELVPQLDHLLVDAELAAVHAAVDQDALFCAETGCGPGAYPSDHWPVSADVRPVPEPAMAGFLAGVLALAVLNRRKAISR